MTEVLTGTDRSAGISYQELLDLDTHPVSEVLRADSPMDPGNTRVPAGVYHDRAWHDLEVDRLWKRVWQLACFEDDIPNVGDYHVYEIAHLSYLIVRTEDGLEAFANSCLHRGRKLRECSGKGAKNLRCPFHGWAWNLDGSLKEIPCQWDFPDVDTDEYGLDRALVDTWEGFVFINPDLSASPLAEFLDGIDPHFENLPFRSRRRMAHVRKVMPMNWKVCQEAFMEAYHTVATHPTLMENLGDANSRYDVFGDNFSRAISPNGVESPHLANMTRYERIDDGRQFSRWRHPLSGHVYERAAENRVRVIDIDGNESHFDMHGVHLDGPQTQADPHLCMWVGGPHPEQWDDVPLRELDDGGQSPEAIQARRAATAEQRREAVRKRWGDRIDVDSVSDAEMSDAMFYSVFPNWSPWGCFHSIFYRFRPNGDDHNTCLFEVMLFEPFPDDEPRPEPPKVTELGLDDDWSLALELGPLLKVFQQDSLNLPHVHTGLRAQQRQEVVFASYNESKIRHFYEAYFRWVGSPDEQPVSLSP